MFPSCAGPAEVRSRSGCCAPDQLSVVRAGRNSVLEFTAAGDEVMTVILDEGNDDSNLGSGIEPMVAAL